MESAVEVDVRLSGQLLALVHIIRAEVRPKLVVAGISVRRASRSLTLSGRKLGPVDIYRIPSDPPV